MTPAMKRLLCTFAKGADVNISASLVRLTGGKGEEHRFARTTLALLKAKMLELKEGGGLQLSDLGRKTGEALLAKERT